MQIETRFDRDVAQLRLAGRFDFNVHRDFRSACEAVLERAGVGSVVIDLGGVDYLDSSALGMLLIVREKAGQAGKTLALSNPRPGVKQVLDIANFGKLFQFI